MKILLSWPDEDDDVSTLVFVRAHYRILSLFKSGVALCSCPRRCGAGRVSD